jgi:hypothetical protein
MTTIKNKYVGIAHPVTDEGLSEKKFNVILEAWKTANCSQGIHLFDEVHSINGHYLHCDACGMEVYIEKIVIPDGKDQVI